MEKWFGLMANPIKETGKMIRCTEKVFTKLKKVLNV
jgi:hypothetical protein